MKTDYGNGWNREDGKSWRNGIAKTVKSVLQKRDQGFCNTLTGLDKEAGYAVITGEGQLRSED